MVSLFCLQNFDRVAVAFVVVKTATKAGPQSKRIPVLPEPYIFRRNLQRKNIQTTSAALLRLLYNTKGINIYKLLSKLKLLLKHHFSYLRLKFS
jgi:hypothetical protein